MAFRGTAPIQFVDQEYIDNAMGFLEQAMKMTEDLKTIGDGVGVVTTAGVIVEVLPALSALLTIVWFSIRIYETETVQKLLKEIKK